jgi:hypothetical protein
LRVSLQPRGLSCLAVGLRSRIPLLFRGTKILLQYFNEAMAVCRKALRPQAQIENGVKQAHVILPLVGPNWIGRREDGCSRMDEDNDLVRVEIEYGLKLKKNIIPIVLRGCEFPPSGAPISLEPLFDFQKFTLDPDDAFEINMKSLVNILNRVSSKSLPTWTGLKHS